MTRDEYRSHALSLLQAAKTLVCAGDYLGIVRLLSGSHMTDLWSAAMTAHYGPTGLHASWEGPDGRPSAECLARFPEVGERMAEARLRAAGLIGYYERHG